MMEHFILDGQYSNILNHFGIDVGVALRKAGVAEDVFSRENPTMTEKEYYDFMSAVGGLVPSSDTAIQVVSVNQIESFSPPIFACFCSKNGMNCIERLAKYKLTELLPSGCSSIEEVAGKLGTSKRTLQRKLQDEDTNFQKQLNHVRKLLALNYLKHDDMTSNDIAYLLGYQELNSFLRAFNTWTGMSISDYKMNE